MFETICNKYNNNYLNVYLSGLFMGIISSVYTIPFYKILNNMISKEIIIKNNYYVGGLSEFIR